jgi:hypothetical protein
MIKIDDQRRWWFATHPEFSSSRKYSSRDHDDDDNDDSTMPTPKDIDAYADEHLTYAHGTEAILLKELKYWFGTEMASKTPEEQEAILRQKEDHEEEDSQQEIEFDRDDETEPEDSYKELELERDIDTAKIDRTGSDYRKGWFEGYLSIRKGKAPPDLTLDDKSSYAEGVREGAATALDEQEEFAQKWIDPVWMSLGNRHSRALNRNLRETEGERPSDFHDGHHIVPWRHWRATPARDILQKFGIDIDGAANGVWLRRDYHWTLNNSNRYFDTVNHALRRANTKQDALQILK